MFTLDHDTLFAAKNQAARDAARAFKGFISVESDIIILALKLQNHELFTKYKTRKSTVDGKEAGRRWRLRCALERSYYQRGQQSNMNIFPLSQN